jgi:hypothetical protein
VTPRIRDHTRGPDVLADDLLLHTHAITGRICIRFGRSEWFPLSNDAARVLIAMLMDAGFQPAKRAK